MDVLSASAKIYAADIDGDGDMDVDVLKCI